MIWGWLVNLRALRVWGFGVLGLWVYRLSALGLGFKTFGLRVSRL